jgi:DNA-directed RNA polymerase
MIVSQCINIWTQKCLNHSILQGEDDIVKHSYHYVDSLKIEVLCMEGKLVSQLNESKIKANFCVGYTKVHDISGFNV